MIIPASELSQHISTAGTEASGTSNMKFVMNGCLIIGTMDGANVEIAEEIGKENMFIFGEDVDGVARIRKEMNEGRRDYIGSSLKAVFDAIFNGYFGDLGRIHEYLGRLMDGGDYFITCSDFHSYCEAQAQVDLCYRNYTEWTTMAIKGVAKCGKFSSDRTIAEYCHYIWDTEPAPVPHPSTNPSMRVKSFANLPGNMKPAERKPKGQRKTK